MRAVVQRVIQASVSVNCKLISEVGYGLLVLLGVHHDDNEEDMDWLVKKTSQLRIFNDADGVMNLDIIQAGGNLMVVSQFTLLASTKKRNRLSYIAAMEPVTAEKNVNEFIHRLENILRKPVAKGVFGAHMKINLLNDGPVTIILDSKNKDQ
jgi:D-aminoacyl-tRNA deacylase